MDLTKLEELSLLSSVLQGLVATFATVAIRALLGVTGRCLEVELEPVCTEAE
jgi:hypothetical protein